MEEKELCPLCGIQVPKSGCERQDCWFGGMFEPALYTKGTEN